jgi:salicylate hydroxylase
MEGMRIAVVGAGIGGLAVGAALNRAGMRCTLYERASEITDAGHGIQISPNGARVLHRLGVAATLDAVACRPAALELRRWQSNELVGRVELGAAAEDRYEAPYYTLHRVDLVRALAGVVTSGGTETVVRPGRRCVRVGERRDRAELEFADGSVETADIAIGADGINSVVRRALARDTARFSGHTVYRGQVPAARVPWWRADARVVVWLGPGQHCVCYPISGGRLLNFSATVPAPTAATSIDAPADEVLAAYAGWHRDVRTLLGAAGTVRRSALYDLPPLRSWHSARLVLLGDAAHAMLPFIAQGATQAIEDAVTLAACLRTSRTSGLLDAFERYETIRRPRVARVRAVVRANARDHHLTDGARQRRRDRETRARDLAAHDWLFGHDAERAVCLAGTGEGSARW